ncbi:MAG: hypothetical protein U1F61_00975 [Opitutaceae bacterium]
MRFPEHEPSPPRAAGSRAAFSLVELLGVLAVVAVLGGILLPVTAQVRGFALKVRTRSTFAQWALAFEQFRADTGAYPQVVVDGRLEVTRFLGALCAQSPSGGPAAAEALQGNVRRTRYLEIAPDEWIPDGRGGGELVDGFGNSQIVVLIDADGDGLIRGDERVRLALARGNTRDGLAGSPLPTDPDLAAEGGVIRAGVAFYSAGRGQAGSDYVLSWK